MERGRDGSPMAQQEVLARDASGRSDRAARQEGRVKMKIRSG